MEEEEVIIIEEEKNYKNNEYYQSFSSLKKKKEFPWYFRILFFFGAFMLTFLIGFLAFFVAFIFLMDLVTLFQLKNIHQGFVTAWKFWCKLFAFLLGFVVAIFSPQFGLAIMVAYLLLQGESIQQEYFMRKMNF